MIERIAAWRPFLWLLGLTILLVAIGYLAHPQYDDGGLGFLWAIALSIVSISYRAIALPLVAIFGDAVWVDVVAGVAYVVLLIVFDRLLLSKTRRTHKSD